MRVPSPPAPGAEAVLPPSSLAAVLATFGAEVFCCFFFFNIPLFNAGGFSQRLLSKWLKWRMQLRASSKDLSPLFIFFFLFLLVILVLRSLT